MSERVIYNYQTGRPNDVLSSVLRSISAYTRVDRATAFKIGITCNPENRFRQAYADSYDKMLVVYQSSSVNNVRDLERLLLSSITENCATTLLKAVAAITVNRRIICMSS